MIISLLETDILGLDQIGLQVSHGSLDVKDKTRKYSEYAIIIL